MSIVFGLLTGGMHVSSVRFCYMCDSYELLTLGYDWVTWKKIHLVNRMLRSYLSLGAIL
jgi:hypothetical protein